MVQGWRPPRLDDHLDNVFSRFEPEREPTKEEVEAMLKKATADLHVAEAALAKNARHKQVVAEREAIEKRCDEIRDVRTKMLQAATSALVRVRNLREMRDWTPGDSRCGVHFRRIPVIELQQSAEKAGIEVPKGILATAAEQAVYAHLNQVEEWRRLRQEMEDLTEKDEVLEEEERTLAKARDEAESIVSTMRSHLQWWSKPHENHPQFNTLVKALVEDEGLKALVEAAAKKAVR